MSEYKLTEGIVNLSQSDIWDVAKFEWELDHIYEAEEPDTCLCGHYPIIEICILRNKVNRNSATVGNCCVKKFIGLPSDKIFQALKRVRKDDEKALNSEAIHHAYTKGWINEWEHTFYMDTWRKRNLSMKQMAARKKVNAKVLNNVRQQNKLPGQ